MKTAIGVILGAMLLVTGTTALQLGVAGEREWEYGHEGDEHRHGRRARGAAPQYPLYRDECGACHTAYPPGLLPAASWERLMDGLADHFGDNAELLPQDAAAVRTFLTANAADAGRRSAGDDAPLRISATRWFRHEHDELPRRLVEGNPEVASFANCSACHPQALQGDFDEHGIRIPGYGRWDD